MKKRNIAAAAAVISAFVAVAFTVFPVLNHSKVMHLFQFPAILLTVIIADNGRSPSALAEWTSFLAYMLVWSAAFIVVYALLLDMYLSRKAARHLKDAHVHWQENQEDASATLVKIGHAVIQREAGRRNSWFLTPDKSIGETDAPEAVALKVLNPDRKNDRVALWATKQLASHLAVKLSAKAAEKILAKLQKAALTRGPGGAAHE